ncbi:tyrosine-type recombinase/integrase [Gordonia sp. DT101]|uniref:tyrosine-type recombinase/integrase n=1 Tax=Gordonia sp. DT101 TaxID=3416545 RepID=UPI003CE96F7E
MAIVKRQWGENSKPRYEARVRVGGKSRSKSFGTRKEAQDWERDQLGKKPTGRRTDNKLMGVAVKAWAGQATGSTGVGRMHLVGNLGDLADKKVGDVDSDDIRDWRAELAEGRPWAGGRAFKSSTISTLTKHLSAFFNDAVTRDQIPRNPVLGVRRGTGTVNEGGVIDPAGLITVAEVRKLLDKADEPVGTMLELMATSGLRPNEVAGLRVSSVDFGAGAVHVMEQASGVYGAWDWKVLKSAKSRRSIPLPDSTVTRLRMYLADHQDYLPKSPLFRTERGYQWSSAHFYREWVAVAEPAGVAGHSPKSLRHFYASKLIRAGESVAVVQARLGHASPMVTLGTYVHLWEDSADTTRAAVEGLFSSEVE